MNLRLALVGCFATLFGVLTSLAQTATVTDRVVEAPATVVETRTTTTPDGQTVVERLSTTTQRERSATSRTYAAAVVVSNRADPKWNDKVSALEDLLSARLADHGFRLVSRELVTSNLRQFVPSDAPADDESARSAAAAEAAFLDQSSALRLAQSLGVDYVLHASIASYAESQRTTTAYGTALKNHTWTMRVAYKVLDAQGGGSLVGDVIQVNRTEQANEHASALLELEGVFDDLLDEASRQLAGSLRVRSASGRIAQAKPAAKSVTITLRVEAADLYIPDVRLTTDNVVVLGESQFKLTPLNATVEVDGVAVGVAPGPITLKPGFSRLRLSREGFEPWERTINATDGQVLSAALTMSSEGLTRFRQSTEFLHDLKNEAKLTDAHAKALEGLAKMLEQSGLKVDYKVDTKENLKFALPLNVF